MLEDKFKVDGRDFKKLPLRVAYYARNKYDIFRDKEFEERVAFIQDFINKETSWELVAGYNDPICSTVFQQTDFQELLDAACSWQFDVIVVTELSQITDDPVIEKYILGSTELAYNEIPIFCIDEETMVSIHPENVEKNLLDCISEVE